MDMQNLAASDVVVRPGASPRVALAARETLAQAFGLSLAEASRMLVEGGVIARPQVRPDASSLTLLRILGVELQATLTRATRYDLSVRLAHPRDAEARAQVERFCPADQLDELEGPSGLVLEDLGPDAARALSLSLQRKPGVLVTMDPQAGGRCDLFGPEGRPVPAGLRAHLRLCGLGEAAPVAGFADAIATGLEPAAARQILARFPDEGLFAVRHAFQRFRLTVTGAGALSPREAGDFLAGRGFAEAGLRLNRGKPAPVERGLKRCDARQFLNDYLHIGLIASARLERGTPRNG